MLARTYAVSSHGLADVIGNADCMCGSSEIGSAGLMNSRQHRSRQTQQRIDAIIVINGNSSPETITTPSHLCPIPTSPIPPSAPSPSFFSISLCRFEFILQERILSAGKIPRQRCASCLSPLCSSECLCSSTTGKLHTDPARNKVPK
ncbi:unnamed protein product [Pleuronectes platessa]|uniref:Uncharacterized protein n=1 Tax=Pleuronectes platessa TaxID=8262 RepID=A0A9N7Z8P0_PLEPL|nr:unnamed protein product [Pleuronectes platessa]